MMKRILTGTLIAIVGLFASSVLQTARGQSSPARPKITGIDHVRLYISDVGKSRAFYGDVLGLPAGGGNCTGDARPCFAVNAGFSTSWSEYTDGAAKL